MGRGTRDLNSSSEMTLIIEKPLTLDVAEYLSRLDATDAEMAEGL